MSERYILRNRQPVLEPDLHVWARAFDSPDRIVKRETLPNGVDVSTVFLGLDHSFGSGPPLLFETMIFGGPLSDDQWRCSTWAEAEAQHAKAVEAALAAVPGEQGDG